MDINRMLRTAITTGDVWFGINQVKKAVKAKKAKLLVVASDCPETDFKAKNTYHFKGNNIELGTACGKPFGISALAIVAEGESNILSIKKE